MLVSGSNQVSFESQQYQRTAVSQRTTDTTSEYSAASGTYGTGTTAGYAPALLGAKSGTDQEILNQSRELLEKWYQQTPDGLQQVKQGQIPDYWGVQQTGQRIFDVLVSAFAASGEAGEDFYDQAKNVLDQAYGDAARIFGNLPGLVTDTRDALYQALDAVKNGTSLQDARAAIGASNQAD